jgi:hypothetical protein
MNVAEFEDLLDRLGDEIAGWPALQREAADLLLSSSAPARQLLDEARQLRRALSAPAIPAPAGLTGRIMAAVRAPEPAVADAEATASQPPPRDPRPR